MDMKRILFAISLSFGLLFTGCSRKGTDDPRSLIDTCTASEDIVPDFLARYDSVTDDNLDAFIRDWYAYSQNVARNLPAANTLDSLCFEEFKVSNDLTDSSFQYYDIRFQYIVLPLQVEVSCFMRKLNPRYDSESDCYHFECPRSEGRQIRWMTPVFPKQYKILYLTNRIYEKLEDYVGGGYDSSKDTEMPIHKEHCRWFAEQHYFPIVYGHWGGYWNMESMPIVLYIRLFKDGVLIGRRTSFNTGDDTWYGLEEGSLQRHQTCSWWME